MRLPENLDYATLSPADRFRLTKTENNVAFDNMALGFLFGTFNGVVKEYVS